MQTFIYQIDAESMTMKSSDQINNKKDIRLTIRMDQKTYGILKILQDKTSLSKAGIFRLALINFYEQELIKESQIKKD